MFLKYAVLLCRKGCWGEGFSAFQTTCLDWTPGLAWLELQCFQGSLLERNCVTRSPAWLGTAHNGGVMLQAPSLILRHSLSSHSCSNNPFPWKLVPAAGEELGLGCDRDRQWVVEDKAEWGGGWTSMGAEPSESSARAPGGPRTFSWRLPGWKQGQTEEFKVRFSVHRNSRWRLS